ncbi:MAG: hypothetical protein PHF86_13355 [Candidatus Nanoarchaeia archaeon]|jgi:hypothetical protein|nr:hypothetical protein [Candidatus Nanoarchaeia archaeon]
MDPLNGIFDQGFSGILDSTPSRKTMPDYIEKLAEQEINYEPPKLEVPVIPYEKDSGLSRANELTSDGSRESNIENRFTAEKSQRIAQDVVMKTIDRTVETLIRDKKSFEQIHTELLSKYAKEQVFKYLESSIRLHLNEYSFLGFENLEEKHANIIEQAKIDFKIRRATVHDILDKFSGLEFITKATIKEYKDLLEAKRPVFVASKFLFSLDSIKRSYYNAKEARVAFQRDADEKDLHIREVKNNDKKNAALQKQAFYAEIMSDWKKGLNSRLSQSEIGKMIAHKYSFNTFRDFVETHKEELKKLERFARRQNFDTNFASSTLQGVEIEPKSKPLTINTKAMTNHAFNLMTMGDDLETVKSSLRQKFGFEAANQFWTENDYKLQRHYGQIGYVFIDSNIYTNCDEMAMHFSKIQHAGGKLIYSLKANPKCNNCSLNNCGTCTKVALLVSNSPLVRSPRAVKRVFEKASSFVPKSWIETCAAIVSNDQSKTISTFTLGIQAALDEEKKNIGKRASKDRTETTETQESFVQPDNNFDVELFSNKNSASIIDDILNETKKSSTEWKTYEFPTIQHLSQFKRKLRDNGISFHVSKKSGPLSKIVVENSKDHEQADTLYQQVAQ